MFYWLKLNHPSPEINEILLSFNVTFVTLAQFSMHESLNTSVPQSVADPVGGGG